MIGAACGAVRSLTEEAAEARLPQNKRAEKAACTQFLPDTGRYARLVGEGV